MILWNANHDWVSFRLQLEHGLGAAGRGGAANRILEYVGSEAAMATPILFVIVGLFVSAHDSGGHLGARAYLLAVTGVFTFAWFLFAATRQPVEANWPMLAFPPLAIVASIQPLSKSASRWLAGGVGLGAAMVALIYVHTVVSLLPFPPDNDPVRRGHGWDQVADRVQQATHNGLPGTTHGSLATATRTRRSSRFISPNTRRPFRSTSVAGPMITTPWGTFPQRAAPCDNLVVLLDDARE